MRQEGLKLVGWLLEYVEALRHDPQIFMDTQRKFVEIMYADVLAMRDLVHTVSPTSDEDDLKLTIGQVQAHLVSISAHTDLLINEVAGLISQTQRDLLIEIQGTTYRLSAMLQSAIAESDG